MSKIIKTTTTKLENAQIPQSQPKNEIPEKISLSSNTSKRSIHSFSFHALERERLKNLLSKIQNVSKKKMTATDIIKGLLIIGEELDTEKLIEAICQSYTEHLNS